jgi:hypothetical protein
MERIKFYLLWVLSCFDAVLTKSLIAKFPDNVSEANILMQNVILSDRDTFFIKIVCSLCFITVIYFGVKFIKKEHVKYFKLALDCCLDVYSVVVGLQIIFYFWGDILLGY